MICFAGSPHFHEEIYREAIQLRLQKLAFDLSKGCVDETLLFQFMVWTRGPLLPPITLLRYFVNPIIESLKDIFISFSSCFGSCSFMFGLKFMFNFEQCTLTMLLQIFISLFLFSKLCSIMDTTRTELSKLS